MDPKPRNTLSQEEQGEFYGKNKVDLYFKLRGEVKWAERNRRFCKPNETLLKKQWGDKISECKATQRRLLNYILVDMLEEGKQEIVRDGVRLRLKTIVVEERL